MKKLLLPLLILLGTCGCSNNELSCGDAGISIEEFNKIKIGDTQTTVDKVIDNNDNWNNDEIYNKCVEKISEKKDDKKYSYVYKYIGENGGYALITYTSDYKDFSYLKFPEVSKIEKFNLK